MTFPRITASSPRQPVVPERANGSGTPRVGMHLITPTRSKWQENGCTNMEDDDVSVLTFNTFVTNANTATLKASYNYSQPMQQEKTKSIVEAARETFEKKISTPDAVQKEREFGTASGLAIRSFDFKDQSPRYPSSNPTYISQTLSRLSEEERSGSQVSSSCHSKLSNNKEIKKENEEMKNFDDDDTLSLSQSVLDSASEALTKIRNEKFSPQKDMFSPSLPKNRGGKSWESNNHFESGRDQSCINGYSMNRATNQDNNLSAKKEYGSKSVYQRSENNENINNNANYFTWNNASNGTSPIKIQSLETETRRLQQTLREKQMESQKATKVLDNSIEKAKELLAKVSAERRIRSVS